jgi:hypothetical protein
LPKFADAGMQFFTLHLMDKHAEMGMLGDDIRAGMPDVTATVGWYDIVAFSGDYGSIVSVKKPEPEPEHWHLTHLKHMASTLEQSHGPDNPVVKGLKAQIANFGTSLPKDRLQISGGMLPPLLSPASRRKRPPLPR